MAPKKAKKKRPTKKEQKAIRAEKLKKAEKRKTMVENITEASPTTFQQEYGILNPEKKRKVSNFEISFAEESGESVAESEEEETYCPVELAEEKLEKEAEMGSAKVLESEDIGPPEVDQAVFEPEFDESVALSEESATLSAESETVSQFEFESVEENSENRMKREIKCIRKYLKSESNIKRIYRANEFGPFHPKPEDLEDFEEIPKCPVNETRVERTGKRGRIPKAKPRCQYCDLELLDDYHLYDHYSRRLNSFYTKFFTLF